MPAIQYRSISEIKAANKAIGHHWFDRNTMRAFQSRIESTVYHGRYFISSEQFVPACGPAETRRYTIRKADDDGSISTVGNFQQYASVREARRAARNIID